MVFKPPLVLPVTSPDDPNNAWPNQIQQPIWMRRIIDASQSFFDYTQNADAVGDGIVDYYSATIGNFVNTQRRDYGAGVVQQHSKFLNLPGLTLQYENRQGQERLSMTCYPESAPTGATGLETNNDGYIFWAHADPKFPDVIDNKPGFQTPYDIFLNGYLIYSGFQISQISQGFVIMFGKTALRCHSLVEYFSDQDDVSNPFNGGDFGINSIWGPNGGLVFDVIPPNQPSQQEATTPDGLLVPAHPNEFLYSLFDWGNPVNPGALILEGYVGLTPSWGRWNSGPDPFVGHNPEPLLGVQFADATKSPLNSKGQNYITIMLKAGAPAEENRTVDSITVEFYARQKYATASQTWSYTSGGQNVTYTVTDKPLLFCAAITGGGGIPNMSMGFDLTPSANPQAEAESPLITKPSDPNGGLEEGTFTGLTPEQHAALTAYGAEVTAIINAFNTAQAPVITAAVIALETQETTLANINFFILQYTQGTFNQSQTSPSTFTFENETGRSNPLTGNSLVDAHIEASGTEPGLWIVDESQADFWLTLQSGLSQQTGLVADATVTYTAAITAQPSLPSPPNDAGKPLDAFVWRSVSISGNEWTFGGWQNA